MDTTKLIGAYSPEDLAIARSSFDQLVKILDVIQSKDKDELAVLVMDALELEFGIKVPSFARYPPWQRQADRAAK